MTDQTRSPDWARLRTSLGDAGFVPEVIDRLLHAASPEEATAAYWELDNGIVVQGQLFDSAVPASRVLIGSICGQDYTANGLPRALDLLVELAYGEADASEVERGNSDLGAQCRSTISEGLSCIKALVGHPDERVVAAVVDLVNRMERGSGR